ncbi:MAG: DUF4296 domain-containing protein [Ignavibacteria bacterium]|nr:DUF4296 domain-containing protein [Ignavibacteria bacterium]
MRVKSTNFFSLEKNALLWLTVVGILFFIPCCKDKTTMPKETFISFYAELLLLDSQKSNGRDSLRIQQIEQNVTKLLKKYNTSKEQIVMTAETYSSYPEQWKQIMDSVSERMKNKHFLPNSK